MHLSIDGIDLADIEERILDLADEITERREVVAQGCVCKPRTPTGHVRGGPQSDYRCTRHVAVCEPRKQFLTLKKTP